MVGGRLAATSGSSDGTEVYSSDGTEVYTQLAPAHPAGAQPAGFVPGSIRGCRFESRYPGTLVYPGMNSYPRTSCTQCTGRNWSFHKFNFQHRRVAIRNKHVPGVLLIVLLLSRGEELLEILTRVSEYPGYLGFQFGGTVKIVIDIDDKNEST
eukprot:2594533-Rhodomonas_salina.1